jgi:hypothetical protein
MVNKTLFDEMNKPYIGVTGIEEPSQLEGMLETFSKKYIAPHLLMVGGIVSYKTLIGVKDKPIVLTKNQTMKIFRKLENMSSEDVLFALHYFTKPLNEVRPELQQKAKKVVEKPLHQQIGSLVEDIYERYEREQPPFQIGVQINVSWSKPRDVNQIKLDYPKLKTILQVSDFDSVDERIGKYNVDYALIDTSRGEGKEIDMDKAVGVHDAISKNSKAMIGFAGGFSPQNVNDRIWSLRYDLGTRNFCVDAQGKLRTEDRLDMHKVDEYLFEALRAFQE